jgi:2-methylisocitrate lyase-like PEP mutase family enzyme
MREQRTLPLVTAYDVLSAKLLEQAGITALHVGGYALSAVKLGLPDVGYLTMTEMLESVRRIADSVAVPVIADGDDGYGNHLNVGRLIHELESAGAAGLHMEDQVFPKRCGHMEGKRVVTAAEMVSKIKAAVDARRNADFLIIARTDAIAVTGFDDAVTRANLYAEAGADVLFIEAPETEQQVVAIPGSVPLPTLFNWAYAAKSPMPTFGRLSELGYKLVLVTDALFAAARTLADFYAEVKRSGTPTALADRMFTFGEFNRLIGLDRVDELDRRYRR